MILRPSPFTFASSGRPLFSLIFFFNDTATTEIYTLSLHDALPISGPNRREARWQVLSSADVQALGPLDLHVGGGQRSEEHTSELQSRRDLVCRLLLEKKKKKRQYQSVHHISIHLASLRLRLLIHYD